MDDTAKREKEYEILFSGLRFLYDLKRQLNETIKEYENKIDQLEKELGPHQD